MLSVYLARFNLPFNVSLKVSDILFNLEQDVSVTAPEGDTSMSPHDAQTDT